jgi:predicted DNA-binding transcriptional regulator YafY
MHVSHTPELEREIMGYDQDAKVIEPLALREAILRKARGMLANAQ